MTYTTLQTLNNQLIAAVYEDLNISVTPDDITIDTKNKHIIFSNDEIKHMDNDPTITNSYFVYDKKAFNKITNKSIQTYFKLFNKNS